MSKLNLYLVFQLIQLRIADKTEEGYSLATVRNTLPDSQDPDILRRGLEEFQAKEINKSAGDPFKETTMAFVVKLLRLSLLFAATFCDFREFLDLRKVREVARAKNTLTVQVWAVTPLSFFAFCTNQAPRPVRPSTPP